MQRMTQNPARKIAFISSFPPRRCGIATFTSDLIKNLRISSRGHFEPLVVAMESDNHQYNEPVRFEIRRNVKRDYICAADYINFSHVDMVSVQHEFGLFGGEGGCYLTLLLKRLKAPVVTTLHTVLEKPDPDHYQSLVDVCNASYKVITMNERGVAMLRDIYGVSNNKIKLIPHGIPDLPFVDSNYYKHKFGMEGRRTILTFGLLSRNKGIELMLKAMPAIVEAEPSVLYIILGMTHPSVLKHEGKSYRFMLQRMVKELGLREHVIFHNRFVDDEELQNWLCAADVYVTPYQKREQLTSGTLSFAVGTGKAVVSTPYWAATELLANGRGRLTAFDDPRQMSLTVREILADDKLFYSLRRLAYDYGRSRTWPKTSQIYWKLFSGKQLRARFSVKTSPSIAEPTSIVEVPEPSLAHLRKLTDGTGLFQHARFTVPDRDHGYCTDDNARAVIAIVRYYAQYAEPEVLDLLDTYLSFVLHSQRPDGSVRNLMNYDRSWVKNEPIHDALGRVLWALGTLMASPPSLSCLPIVKDCFDKSVGLVAEQPARGMAYSILGMCDYLRQFPGASAIKRRLTLAAEKLVSLYKSHRYPDWRWFEDELTYDNAVLPHALFVAGLTCASEKYLDVAEQSCEFLLDNTFNGDHFSFIGCKGWYKRAGTRASFDQQPIEAGGTVMMLQVAYQVTQNERFARLQRKAFDWFLGDNDLQVPLYDFKTKGCNDGLTPAGMNINQGAESMLSFLLSLLTIVESYTRIPEETAVGDARQKAAIEPRTERAKQKHGQVAPIETVPLKNPSSKSRKADSQEAAQSDR